MGLTKSNQTSFKMKIFWIGNTFCPTGISTANRELVKAIFKLGASVQCTDIWNDNWEFNKGLEFLNYPINIKNKDEAITIFSEYPQFWHEGQGRLIGLFLHEGTRLYPEWANQMNMMERMIVPSNATKNLFKWNNVEVPIHVIPYGTNPEIYKPIEAEKQEEFLFLSINSWTGEVGDRKGTDILIKAFDEEFKPEEKVKLILKIGTFWTKISLEHYVSKIQEILGHTNDNILINNSYVPEEELASYYQKADCFVSPTRGEGFGLTILNAMASGLPIIVTYDKNSGHMDFTGKLDSVLYIDAPKMAQADLKFYVQGNMQPIPDLESLKKQMRYAFNNRVALREKAIYNSDYIRREWSWEKSAIKLMGVLNG